MTELNFLAIHLEAGNNIFIRSDKKTLKYKDEGKFRRIPLKEVLEDNLINFKTHIIGKYRIYELYVDKDWECCLDCKKSYHEDSTDRLYCDLEEVEVDLYYKCRFFKGK